MIFADGTKPQNMNLEICERFARLYNGAVADILDEMGYHEQELPSNLRPLAPDMTVHGFAMPAIGRPTTSQDPERIFVPLLKMLGDVKPGHVLVTQANDHVAAHLGELSTTTLRIGGGRGAIIHGGIRDADYIIRMGFPVFCCYQTPLDIVGRWELCGYNVEIEIGNVQIRPGDFISADKDGVLVVPSEIVDEVLVRAEGIVATENHVRKAIVEGVHPLEAYRKYGRF